MTNITLINTETQEIFTKVLLNKEFNCGQCLADTVNAVTPIGKPYFAAPDDIVQDYAPCCGGCGNDKDLQCEYCGDYFSEGKPEGWTNGDEVACNDCVIDFQEVI